MPSVGVPAGVQLLITVQPDIDQFRGHLVHPGESAGGIGDDQRDPVFPAKLREIAGGEGIVPNLDGVPDQRAPGPSGGDHRVLAEPLS